jgi:hypothetical protein
MLIPIKFIEERNHSRLLHLIGIGHGLLGLGQCLARARHQTLPIA